MVSTILVVGVVIQAFFAIAVYKDAYARQDEEGFWGVVTLLFGILGVLLYLVVRPDERVPRSERTSSELTLKMRTASLYLLAAVIGLAVSFPYATSIATMPSGLSYGAAELISEALILTSVIGLPVLLYLYRRDDIPTPTV